MIDYNPYKILNIDEKSSLDEIKKAYRILALKYHPDRNRNNIEEAEQKFKEISKAYNILMKCDGTYNININNNFGDFNNINSFHNLINKGKIFKNFFMNINMENITSNLLKEVISISKYFDETKQKLPKTDPLNINAKIELFDIYHNIEKTISIKRKRICEECFGIGVNLKEKIKICNECLGRKYNDKDISLSFYCKFKSIVFPRKGDECDKYIPGNIYLNIIPKDLRGYKIINNFDLLYIKYIEPNDISINRNYSFELKHFDNKVHIINIDNLVLNTEYIIENMGLYGHNSNKRNNLIIIFMYKPILEKTNIYIL